jgi:multidrug efflux system outer membrane protein
MKLCAAAAFCALVPAFTGCHIGQAYQRPAVPTAPEYRGAESAQPGTAQPSTATTQPGTATTSSQASAAKSIGDEKWWTVFGDPQLQELIRKGIAQNFDARIAAERVVQASAQLGITRADQLPTLSGTASFSSTQMAKGEMVSNPSTVDTNFGKLGLGAAWNLDFWGRYRMATEAARAQLVSSEWAQRAVQTTVVSDIATAYFQLRTLDQQLDIAHQTLVTRQETLKLTHVLEAGGSGSMLDVREAEQLVYTVQAQIADLERQIEQQEDTLSTLLGETPHPIARGLNLDQQPKLPEVPAGLPSELLERRPDIQQAEANLKAANAEIGVARSAYFPQISLTGSTGTDSNALTRLFSGPSHVWNFGPSLSVPIFDASRVRNNVRITESEQRQDVLVYQQTIATAFRDVSKSLVATRKYRELREQQEKIVAAAEDALRLAKLRYEQGQSSYLDVLTNDRTLLGAQLDLATAKQNELLSLVQLYNALGGGWQR